MTRKESDVNNLIKDVFRLLTMVILVGLFFFLLEILGEKLIDRFFNIEALYVPNFCGLTIKEAVEKASKNDFVLKILSEKIDSKYPKDFIISQTPEAGKNVKKGRRIFITLSKGLLKNKIPDVRGKFLRTAEIIIKNNGYILGRKSFVYSEKYDENQVISQTPLPNQMLAKGKNIDLLVSYGKKINNVIIPDLSGKSVIQAKNIIKPLNLKLGRIIYKYEPDSIKGIIRSQLPKSGITSKEGTEIDIIVNDEIKDKVLNSSQDSKLKEVDITFTMPDNPENLKKELRIIAIDDIGTREIFSKKCLPKENVNITANGKGNMRVLFYVEGIVVDSKIY